MATNRLVHEKSPYLLQHQENPVAWYPWGDEALQKAKSENKPIFLSIGYATCHWCHVMAHDSFEDQGIADFLNEHFVSIKLDREERPDLDQAYMDVVVSLTGRGGWPMTVFLTPDLTPFFGGTFFWKPQFFSLLTRIQDLWLKEPERVKDEAQKLVSHLSHSSSDSHSTDIADAKIFDDAVKMYQYSFDETYGGFGQAPKFPRSTDLWFLMRHYKKTRHKDALRMVEATLDAMACGGIYDHLGGGFHRYSTDARWLVPHFEKMLYDNALLASTYLQAAQVTGNPRYTDVACETLDYILRDLTSSEGGFCSAEDADSEGVEGKFYVWTPDEVKALLTEAEFAAVQNTYQLSGPPNFEGEAWILHLKRNESRDEIQSPLLKSAREKLLKVRGQRIRPLMDDKILVDWNGLMIAAMALGARVTGEIKYLKAAQDAAEFIRKKMWQQGALLHRYREGESRFTGLLDDYAFLISGLIELYESDHNTQWLSWAQGLQKMQDKSFWDNEAGGYYYSPPDVVGVYTRKKVTHDGALPCGNAVAAFNLLRLFALTGDRPYQKRADELLQFLSAAMKSHLPAYAMSLVALDWALGSAKEIVMAGRPGEPEVKDLLGKLATGFYPHVVWRVGEEAGRPRVNGKPAFYVCAGTTCLPPVTEAAAALKLLET